mgnify:CR=1 FL=1
MGGSEDTGGGMPGVLEKAVRLFGRGPGFMGFAYLCAAALFVLTYLRVDVSGLTGPLGVVCVGLYGGGAWKAAAEARNGQGAGSP